MIRLVLPLQRVAARHAREQDQEVQLPVADPPALAVDQLLGVGRDVILALGGGPPSPDATS